MKILRALLPVILVTPALVVLSATQALACSCIPARPDKVAVKDAAAVFTGTMAEANVAEPGFTPGVWTFDVDTVYKNVDVAEMQDVTSQTQSAACGLIFKEEKRYAVFAYEDKGRLETNSCTNTRPLAEGKALKLEPIARFENTGALGPGGAEEKPDESAGWDPFVIGLIGMVVLVGIVAVGALAAGRRSRT